MLVCMCSEVKKCLEVNYCTFIAIYYCIYVFRGEAGTLYKSGFVGRGGSSLSLVL